MARTIDEIFDEMIADFDSKPELAAFTSKGAASMKMAFLYIVAVAAFILESFFDEHSAENDEKLATLKPHTARWYVEKAKAFQYGYALVDDEDYYDNSALTEQQIEDSQVIKFAAAVAIYDQNENLKGIRLKVATIDNGDLAKLPDLQMDAFKTYMQQVKDAGVNIYYFSGDPDSLKLDLEIYYDPLVIDKTGKRIDGTNDTPVLDAINDYLLNDMEFNGLFITSKLVDKLQLVDGVEIPYPPSVQANFGAVPYVSVPVKYQPDSGYLRIIDLVNDLTINYIPYATV